jgi:hypothetical protein
VRVLLDRSGPCIRSSLAQQAQHPGNKPKSTGQRLQRPLIAFDAWLLALGR